MPDDNGISALGTLLENRRKTHGSFEECSLVSQLIKNALVMGDAYSRLAPVQIEALHMIAHKMARAVGGEPSHKDTWFDIAGYAMCAHNAIAEYEQAETDKENAK